MRALMAASGERSPRTAGVQEASDSEGQALPSGAFVAFFSGCDWMFRGTVATAMRHSALPRQSPPLPSEGVLSVGWEEPSPHSPQRGSVWFGYSQSIVVRKY